MKNIITLIGVLILLIETGLCTTILVPQDQSTIQGGINAANDGDIVLVDFGTYTGENNRNIRFNGKAITVTSKEKGQPDSTIIDCEGSAQYPRRGFIFDHDEISSAVLKGFKIINGYAVGDGTLDKYGGGIFIYESSPQIRFCRISNCKANRGAGIAIYNSSSSLIKNCGITGNETYLQGDNGFGGGIYIDGLNVIPSIENCIITNNKASKGGGLYIQYSSCAPHISGCTIEANEATLSSGTTRFGGGIYIAYASNSTHIEDCQIISNKAYGTSYGGGMYIWGCNLEIKSCKISQNSCDNHGGGLYVVSAEPEIKFCEISFNEAGYNYYGGGIYLDDADPEIQNCSIVDNSSSNGGALYLSNSSAPTVINCIFWDDTPDEIEINSGSATVTYTDIDEGGWQGGEGNLNAYPEFIDQGNGNYHLEEDSPCIDAGNPNCWLYPVPYNGGARIDMGCYEYDKGFTATCSYNP